MKKNRYVLSGFVILALLGPVIAIAKQDKSRAEAPSKQLVAAESDLVLATLQATQEIARATAEAKAELARATAAAQMTITRPDGACEHCGQSLSQALVRVAKKSCPAVVHIRSDMGNGSNRDPSQYPSDPSNPFEQFQEEFFHRFFGPPSGGRGNGQKPSQQSTGSGFFVSSDGYIVTNHHVIKDAGRILVQKGESEQEFEAQLIGCDAGTDIAILKIQGENLPYLEFANSDDLNICQLTIAIGHPFKLRNTVTVGVISATHRSGLQLSQFEDFIQTDASINPGNSGGPLLDLSGRVIGVNTAILSRSGGSLGVGFAVPSNLVGMVYEQIKQNGCVDRAFLGVQIQDLNEDLCEGFKLKKGTLGALIAEVVAESPAEKGGLKSGDIVTEFNGEPVKNASQLRTNIGKLAAGTKCKLAVLRQGKIYLLDLTLGSQVKDLSVEGDMIHKLGIMLEPVSPENAHKYGLKSDDKGLVITGVIPGTAAALAGWPIGALIVVVNGQKITSITDLKISLEKANPDERLVILLHHKGRAAFHTLAHPAAK